MSQIGVSLEDRWGYWGGSCGLGCLETVALERVKFWSE
jgi:hypothetical protein